MQSYQLSMKLKQRLLLLGLLSFILFLSACDGFNEGLADLQAYDQSKGILLKAKAEKINAQNVPDSPRSLKVMAWNIKYGANRLPFWFDCWGDRVSMSRAEVEANMGKIYALIKEVDPDILMVEEIEVNSRRSAYYDMAQGILAHTALNYGAYFETWDSRYIPSEGLGRLNLGNAIFSKYPITAAEKMRQQDRSDLDVASEIFYIKRAIGKASIQLGTQMINAFVVHTEAYDLDKTKFKQIQQIYELLAQETTPWVIGGDFNELPPYLNIGQALHPKQNDPNALQLDAEYVSDNGFLDERSTAICADDFKQPPYTPLVMKAMFDRFIPWIRLDQIDVNAMEKQRYYTHSVLGPNEENDHNPPQRGDWNRTLDYLFSSQAYTWSFGTVLQRTGDFYDADQKLSLQNNPLDLSDHAPVYGILELR
jgi:endonuclease/exonuclease/phosphatase family metal-dependent hydrolase